MVIWNQGRPRAWFYLKTEGSKLSSVLSYYLVPICLIYFFFFTHKKVTFYLLSIPKNLKSPKEGSH